MSGRPNKNTKIMPGPSKRIMGNACFPSLEDKQQQTNKSNMQLSLHKNAIQLILPVLYLKLYWPTNGLVAFRISICVPTPLIQASVDCIKKEIISVTLQEIHPFKH